MSAEKLDEVRGFRPVVLDLPQETRIAPRYPGQLDGYPGKSPIGDIPNCGRSATRRTRVYVAGPITSSGNLLLNVRRALYVGTQLLRRGYAPYVPHLTCYWEIVAPEDFTYEDWLALDVEYLAVCDALLRLEGKSSGADREMAQFAAMGKASHIYLSTDTLYACEPTTREANGTLSQA